LKPEGSLHHSQSPATSPYPELLVSCYCLHRTRGVTSKSDALWSVS